MEYVGICQLNYFTSIKIFAVEYGINDKVVNCFCIDGKNGKKTKNTIFYDNVGIPYIIKHKKKYNLNNFIRID
jgi:hypothetical protein